MLTGFEAMQALRGRLTTNLQEAATFFRQGEDEQGYAIMSNSFKPLENLLNLAADRKKVAEINEINLQLANALQAMEQGDTVLLADYLEYQILPNIMRL